MTIAPLERQALRALHEGDTETAQRILSDAYTLTDLAILRGAVQSAISTFAASLREGVVPEAVSWEQVAEVVGLAVDDRLGQWPTPGRGPDLRAGIHAELERLLAVIDAACVICARAEVGRD